jgi:hypothetical protein
MHGIWNISNCLITDNTYIKMPDDYIL